MIWVAWRLNRAQLLTVAALTVAGVTFLLYLRSDVFSFIREHHMQACVTETVRSTACVKPTQDFGARFSDLTKLVQVGFATLPIILGVFCGGPLFARELEQGTHVLALTQSVSRIRWFAIKAAVALVPAAAVMAIFTAALWSLVSAQGYAGVLQQGLFNRLTFDTSGIAPAAYTIFAVVTGILLGIATRRTVTAMAGTLGAFAVARFAGEAAREAWLPLLPTQRVVRPIDGIDTSVGATSTVMHSGYLKADGTIVPSDALTACFDQFRGGDPTGCYPKTGVTQAYADVLGGGQFWTAQLIETGLFVAVGAILLAVSVWLLRKRSL
jgi:hypothetical protein